LAGIADKVNVGFYLYHWHPNSKGRILPLAVIELLRAQNDIAFIVVAPFSPFACLQTGKNGGFG